MPHTMRMKAAVHIALLAITALALRAQAATFTVTNLVSDDGAAHPAQISDPGLVNGWGLALGASGPFRAAANGTGTSTVYTVDAATQVTARSGPTLTTSFTGARPAGVLLNADATAFDGDSVLFVNTDGSITGWRSTLSPTAETLALSGSSVDQGAAIATVGGSSYLYAANLTQGRIDVFKGTASAPNLGGSFVDPVLPSGYAPFNVQVLDGSVYVTYAKKNATGLFWLAGAGLGFVDRYTLTGNFLDRVASQGPLNGPWGLAIAPSSFGALAGSLLVANAGDGRISAYDRTSLGLLGQLSDSTGSPIAIDGLRAIAPGNDGSAGSSADLYFTAGPDGGTHGVFGVLSPVPEAPAWALWALGLIGLRLLRRHSCRPTRALLLLLTTAAAALPSHAAGNLVANGQLDFAGPGAPTHWSFLNPGGESWDSFGGNPSPDGGSYLGIQDLASFTPRVNAGGITQLISGLDVGATYTLTFYSMTNHDAFDAAARQDWVVSFGSDTQTGQQTHYTGTADWVQSSLVFTAHAAAQALTFAAEYLPGSFPEMLNLDGIVLTKTAAAVPEPSSGALFIGGLLAAGAAVWRRRARG